MFTRSLSFVAVAFLLGTSLAADTVTCRGGSFSVQNAADRAVSICKAAERAKEKLASCNLTVVQPVMIEITETLPKNCYGLYECDDELIKLRPVEGFVTYLSNHPDGLFAHLNPETFFHSVLLHELVHVALRKTPCPYEVCPVTREFVAYSMQIRFLSDADRAPFDQYAMEIERPMTRDDLSAIALMMVPEVFIKNAHAFLSQQDDPCTFIGAIAKGEIILDMPYRK